MKKYLFLTIFSIFLFSNSAYAQFDKEEYYDDEPIIWTQTYAQSYWASYHDYTVLYPDTSTCRFGIYTGGIPTPIDNWSFQLNHSSQTLCPIDQDGTYQVIAWRGYDTYREEDSFVLHLEVPAVCGDGIVNGVDECDDGNQVDTDGCKNDCTTSPALLATWVQNDFYNRAILSASPMIETFFPFLKLLLGVGLSFILIFLTLWIFMNYWHSYLRNHRKNNIDVKDRLNKYKVKYEKAYLDNRISNMYDSSLNTAMQLKYKDLNRLIGVRKILGQDLTLSPVLVKSIISDAQKQLSGIGHHELAIKLNRIDKNNVKSWGDLAKQMYTSVDFQPSAMDTLHNHIHTRYMYLMDEDFKKVFEKRSGQTEFIESSAFKRFINKFKP